MQVQLPHALHRISQRVLCFSPQVNDDHTFYQQLTLSLAMAMMLLDCCMILPLRTMLPLATLRLLWLVPTVGIVCTPSVVHAGGRAAVHKVRRKNGPLLRVQRSVCFGAVLWLPISPGSTVLALSCQGCTYIPFCVVDSCGCYDWRQHSGVACMAAAGRRCLRLAMYAFHIPAGLVPRKCEMMCCSCAAL